MRQPRYRPTASLAFDVVAALSSDATRGLATDEARERLATYGRNELPAEPPIPTWYRFLTQFQDPLTILLLIATVISFVAWIIEREESLPYESITILAIVLLNGVLGYIQENRAEQAVAASEQCPRQTPGCSAMGNRSWFRRPRWCLVTSCSSRRATPVPLTGACWRRLRCAWPSRP